MLINADLLRTQIDYMSWANRRLVDAGRALSAAEQRRDFGTADKSILGTLVHIFAAERVWLARLESGTIQEFVTEADYEWPVLENDWRELEQCWKSWARNLADEAIIKPLSYADRSGKPRHDPVWQIVLHLVNHGTHHRGQVSGFLRSLGHTPPSLDLIQYYRNL